MMLPSDVFRMVNKSSTPRTGKRLDKFRLEPKVDEVGLLAERRYTSPRREWRAAKPMEASRKRF